MRTERTLPDQDLEVLDGCNEVVLHGLLGQAPPAGTFEAMLNGRLTEVAFLEPLPTLSIPARCRAVIVSWPVRLPSRQAVFLPVD